MACCRGSSTQLCRVHQYSCRRGTFQLRSHRRWSFPLSVAASACFRCCLPIFGVRSHPKPCFIAAQHGVSPNTKQIWWVAAAQGITFFLSDVIGISIEQKYHQFDFAKYMPKKPKRILFFLMVTQLVGSTR